MERHRRAVADEPPAGQRAVTEKVAGPIGIVQSAIVPNRTDRRLIRLSGAICRQHSRSIGRPRHVRPSNLSDPGRVPPPRSAEDPSNLSHGVGMDNPSVDRASSRGRLCTVAGSKEGPPSGTRRKVLRAGGVPIRPHQIPESSSSSSSDGGDLPPSHPMASPPRDALPQHGRK